MGKTKTAPSNLTVNAALYETVRCELNDAEGKLFTAENAVESLTRVNGQLHNELKDAEQTISDLQDDLDTVVHFQDATDLVVKEVEDVLKPATVQVNVISAEELFYYLRFDLHHTEKQLDELRRGYCRLWDKTIESGPVKLMERDGKSTQKRASVIQRVQLAPRVTSSPSTTPSHPSHTGAYTAAPVSSLLAFLSTDASPVSTTFARRASIHQEQQTARSSTAISFLGRPRTSGFGLVRSWMLVDRAVRARMF
eukprot:COSAG06_NODE_14796_length_1125_cov_1.417154_2_plen_253_part_00